MLQLRFSALSCKYSSQIKITFLLIIQSLVVFKTSWSLHSVIVCLKILVSHSFLSGIYILTCTPNQLI